MFELVSYMFRMRVSKLSDRDRPLSSEGLEMLQRRELQIWLGKEAYHQQGDNLRVTS